MLSNKQQTIIATYIKNNPQDADFARSLAREMLTVRSLGLEADDFEQDDTYRECFEDDQEFIKQVVTNEFKGFFELYEDDFEPSYRVLLGIDNKFYDECYCEVPLKEVKNTLKTTKGVLTKMRINEYIETSAGDIEFLNDWENLSL